MEKPLPSTSGNLSARGRLAPGGLTLRLRLLAAFCALSVITLSLGSFSVRSVGRSGAMVAAIFDRAL
ncbi:MAG: hypothetical protein AVDCRST_MAG08-1440, partial [uncultured Acetobacteraceae bacterium]